MIISFVLGVLLGDIPAALNNAPMVDLYPRNNALFRTLPLSDDKPIPQPTKIVRDNKESVGIALTARAAIVVDVTTGAILFEKSHLEKTSMASLTKLMTALVFTEHNPGWDTTVTMRESDERSGASPHIYRGETVKVRDLFYTSLIGSDNNSTVALVRVSGLDDETFVAKMNEKAKALGLTDTTFADPTGLDDGNVSSAFDVSKLVFYAMKIPEIRESTKRSKQVISILDKGVHRTVYNTDILLDSYIHQEYTIEGGKTGFTPDAGSCLAVQVKGKQNNPIIVVVMGSRDNTLRFNEVKALTQWTYDNYQWN